MLGSFAPWSLSFIPGCRSARDGLNLETYTSAPRPALIPAPSPTLVLALGSPWCSPKIVVATSAITCCTPYTSPSRYPDVDSHACPLSVAAFGLFVFVLLAVFCSLIVPPFLCLGGWVLRWRVHRLKRRGTRELARHAHKRKCGLFVSFL